MESRGTAGFESHYSSIYGPRWPGISKALRKETRYTTLIPPFISEIPEQNEFEAKNNEFDIEGLLGSTYYRNTDMPFCYDSIEIDSSFSANLESNGDQLYAKKQVFNANSFVSTVFDCSYTMEYSVAYACHCLGVKPGDKVLDIFGHTGGHSLLFASILFYESTNQTGVSDKDMSTMDVVNMINRRREKMLSKKETSLLVCCDPRRAMHEKTVDTIKKYLPEKLVNAMQIQTVSYEPGDHNLRRFGNFDHIFIRMPPLYDMRSLQKWSYSAVKTNSKKALSALNSAVKLLRPKGSIIYCNHSMDPLDNELVIHTLLQSFPKIRQEPIDLKATVARMNDYIPWKAHLDIIAKLENRKYGYALMPDDTPFGPLYMCKLVLSE